MSSRSPEDRANLNAAASQPARRWGRSGPPASRSRSRWPLRHNRCFEVAAALIPQLAPWVDSGRFEPITERFDGWCTATIRPWYEDHRHWDATLLHRLAGGDIDIEARIPSDVVCAAAEIDPTIWPAAGPYLAMQALPSALDPVRDKARAILRTGWRPPYAAGPSREELADAILQPQGRSAA